MSTDPRPRHTGDRGRKLSGHPSRRSPRRSACIAAAIVVVGMSAACSGGADDQEPTGAAGVQVTEPPGGATPGTGDATSPRTPAAPSPATTSETRSPSAGGPPAQRRPAEGSDTRGDRTPQVPGRTTSPGRTEAPRPTKEQRRTSSPGPTPSTTSDRPTQKATETRSPTQKALPSPLRIPLPTDELFGRPTDSAVADLTAAIGTACGGSQCISIVTSLDETDDGWPCGSVRRIEGVQREDTAEGTLSFVEVERGGTITLVLSGPCPPEESTAAPSEASSAP